MSTNWSHEAIRFYCGLGEKHYNHHPVVTGPYACVSPVSGSEVKKVNSVAVPQGVQVLQDSGAFNDACLLLRGQERRVSLMKQCRLSFKDALKRQEQHAIDFGYADLIEARASYDVLIDETWIEDASGLLIRRKKRWSETDADLAASFSCDPGGNYPNNQAADLTLNVTSHEQMEAATDPQGNAWIDSSGSEIGDKCAWTFGPRGSDGGDISLNGNSYLLQQEWDNNQGGCVMSGP